MKVYIDYHKLSIVDINREKPFYQGSNFIDKIRLLINFKDANMRPDLTLRLPTGRRIGPLMAIGLEEGGSREIRENGTNWYYYDFILSSETGALEHYGQLEASVCLNYYDDKGFVKRQAVIGTIVNEIVKTTYLGNNNNIVIIGDNADEVVTDLVNLTSQLANRQDLVDDACLTSTLLTQAIDVSNFNPNGDKLALVFEEGEVYIRDSEGTKIASFSNDEFRTNLVSTARLMADDLETRNLSVANKIKSKLVPYLDKAYDLGSNVKAWGKLYLDGKGLLMRTNHIKEDGTPVNIRPIRVEDERLVVSTHKDGEEKKAISIAPDKIDIFLPELMSDSSVASLETYGGQTVIRIASVTSDSKIKIDTSCYIKLNGDEQGMIATPNELNIIPELVNGVIPFTLNRIKLGGHEYVAEGQKEDVMFTFKPANSEGQVVPFAITKEGKVYCKGYEIATKNDINNIIGGAPEALDTLIELSKALNNDANFASNVINTITSNYTELNGKLTALSKSLSAANDAIAKEVSDRQEADKTTLDEAKRYTDSELSKGKIQLGSEPYNYIAVENREDGEPLVIHADDCIHLNTVNGGVEVNNNGDLVAFGNVEVKENIKVKKDVNVDGNLIVNGGAVINGAIDSIELDGSIKFTQNTNNQIKVDEDDDLIIAFDSRAKLGDVVTIDKDNVEVDGGLYVNGDNITNLIHSNSAAISQEAKDRDEAINNAITKLVNGSPEALDTLLELSEALGNDPNFATTITNALAKKVDKEANKTLIYNYDTSDCDFNDYKSSGFYRFNTNLTNSPHTDFSNAPENYYDVLIIGASETCTQIASYPKNNIIYARKYSSSEGWGTWIRIDGQDKANLTDFNNLKSDYEAFKSGAPTSEDLTSANLLINKNLYNLGAYDTIVDNGDGTATITRQTGYVTLDGSEYWIAVAHDKGTPRYTIKKDPFTDLVTHKNNELYWCANLYSTTANNNYTQSILSLAFDSGNCAIITQPDISTVAEFKEWLSQNPVYVQYKLKTSYTEKVILKQPLLDLPQDGTEWLREEWEKGINLLDASKLAFDNGNNVTSSGFKNENGTITISYQSEVNDPYVWCHPITLDAGTYTLSFNGTNDQYIIVATTSNNFSSARKVTFTLNETSEIRIRFDASDTSITSATFSNIMLNKGSHALPYKPYSGELIRQREFDNLKGSLSAVATSGKYSDLIGVPEGLGGLKKTLLYSGAIASSNTALSISALSSNILKTRGLLVFDFAVGVYSGGTFVKQQNTLGSIIISTQDIETLDSGTYYHGTLNYSIPNSYLGGSGSVSENMNNNSQEVGLIALTISYSGQVGFRKSTISGSVSWGSYTPLLTNIWRIE